jgi:HK97 family phage major capsid protein
MLSVQACQEKLDELTDRVTAIVAVAEEEKRDLTDEETQEIDTIQGLGDERGQIGEWEIKLERARKLEARQKAEAARRVQPELERPANGEFSMAAVKVPAKAKARGRVRAFIGEDAEKEAYLAGLFYQASMFGNTRAEQRLSDLGIKMAQSTTDNTAGGYLVPEILEASIIRNVEDYGVARRYCRVMPVGGGSLSIPRRASGYTAYFVAENAAGTASDLGFDQITLDPVKLMVLSQWSTELPEDAVVQLGDLITQEIAYAFANKEDECLFNGDGTSTYGGIVGCANALAAGSIVTTASDVDTFAEITNATFEAAIGALHMVPGIQPAWFIHQSGWANTMQRLSMAGGGNNVMNFEEGVGYRYMGYPVVISQVLQSGAPGTDISGNIFAYFGDMALTAAFGDKRGVTISTDSSVYFTSDAIALKGTERFDINVHERGSASDGGTLIALKANAA